MTIARKTGPVTQAQSTYDGDYYGWLMQQAALLDAGQVRHADLSNIAEALRDLGSEQFFRLESSLRVLCMRVLKWDHQPSRRSQSWSLTIKVQRNAVRRLLDRNPSLKSRLAEAMASAFEDARIDAAKETDLDEAVFPLSCPYSLDDLMNREMAWPSQE